jgi:GNAT superfamily N-acetyltransferase
MTAVQLSIRDATSGDLPLLVHLIRQLAIYEKLEEECQTDADGLECALFGPDRFVQALLAESKGEPVGFALFFLNFSTFLGKPGIYLEDLFVLPAYRGKGIGKALLAAVAARAVERGCGRFEWSVLKWNEGAIRFYASLGAVAMEGWQVYRMTGTALRQLASEAKNSRQDDEL